MPLISACEARLAASARRCGRHGQQRGGQQRSEFADVRRPQNGGGDHHAVGATAGGALGPLGKVEAGMVLALAGRFAARQTADASASCSCRLSASSSRDSFSAHGSPWRPLPRRKCDLDHSTVGPSCLRVAQFLALKGGIVVAAMRTIIVARCRPDIGPGAVATFANIEILEQRRGGFIRRGSSHPGGGGQGCLRFSRIGGVSALVRRHVTRPAARAIVVARR